MISKNSERSISPAIFSRMILAGAKMLEVNRNHIDSLNVFPVPDGDTGINMSLTMASSIKEIISNTNSTMSAVCDGLAKGALRGARGNSGVILSQILKGMANTYSIRDELEPKMFAKGLQAGVDLAYSAVAKPREGTMLTVIRVVAENALELSKHSSLKMEDFLHKLVIAGEEILSKTPDMLDVLKKAGVVDSGGYGIVVMLKGFEMGYLGIEVAGAEDYRPQSSSTSSNESSLVNIDYTALDEIEFAYCTEFFIVNILKKTTVADIDKLREKLNAIGDSTLVIGDLSLVKVHVHTNKPGVALSYALDLGEVDKIKIENMLEQNRELKAKYEAERKPIGLLSVCAGSGFNSIFKDLLVDQVIEGGQTMNPAAEDFANAISKINAENIIILPNNKNIILAAEQSRTLVGNKRVYVVPTKNIPQGLAATLAYNPELSIGDNLSNMNDSLLSVKAGSVTYAVRSSMIDNITITEGDIIGLDSNKILTKGNDPSQVTTDLILKMKDKSHEVITLFYGNDVSEDQAESFADDLRKQFPNCEIDMHFGGQPLYYYIFSLE